MNVIETGHRKARILLSWPQLSKKTFSGIDSKQRILLSWPQFKHDF